MGFLLKINLWGSTLACCVPDFLMPVQDKLVGFNHCENTALAAVLPR